MAKRSIFTTLGVFPDFFDIIPMNLMVRIQKRIIEHEIKKLKHELYTLEE